MTTSNYIYQLTRSDRRALAIIANRLTVGDMGKDKFRMHAYDLARLRPDLVTMDSYRWHLTDEGRKQMAKATPRGCNYARWAEDLQAGAGKVMAALLNEHGTDAGYVYFRRLEDCK